MNKESGIKKYNPNLVPICGSVNAVILFLELQELFDSGEDRAGLIEFDQTDKQLQESLGFKRKQLENAKEKLLKKGLISYRVLGDMNKKTYYTINLERFMEYIKQFFSIDNRGRVTFEYKITQLGG